MAQVRNIVNPCKAPDPLGMYSLAVRTDGQKLLLLSGQLSVDKDGNTVGVGDVGAQARQVFDNIGAALEDSGASYDDILKLTTFVVGQESLAGFLEARTTFYPEIFPKGDYPPNTLLLVSGLAKPEFLVEVEVIAAAK